MTQGGLVVADVAQFVIKAREELSAFEREQLTCVDAQQHLVREKEQLAVRVQALEESLQRAELIAHEQEFVIGQLRSELVAERDRHAMERAEQQAALASGEEAAESEAQVKIRTLQEEVASARAAGERKAELARREAGALVASEIAALKARISAMEHQLEMERERRVRLMDVVKAHDVHVATPAKRIPEVVT
jgi:hypothetical protein